VNTSASLDDGEIIQEVLDCKSAESDSDTEDVEKDTVVKKISVNEGIDALKKSMACYQLHRLSLLRQTSIELFLQ